MNSVCDRRQRRYYANLPNASNPEWVTWIGHLYDHGVDHRQIKAAVGGVIAAAIEDPAVFVSVAALHQGPPGGGPVAALVELFDD